MNLVGNTVRHTTKQVPEDLFPGTYFIVDVAIAYFLKKRLYKPVKP